MNNEEQDYALGWDDEAVAVAQQEFPILPEGDYDFTVKSFERGQYEPGPNSKLPAAPKAIIHLHVKNAAGQEGDVIENIILTKKMQWKRDAFFIAIGQAVEGQSYRPNWNAIVGATGAVEIEINKYTSNGKERENNRVAKYLDHTAPAVGQGYQAPQTNAAPFPGPANQQGGYQPGAF
jgi:hypothetical protein